MTLKIAISFLVILSTWQYSNAQNKCLFSQNIESQNHIKSWSAAWDRTDSLFTIGYEYATSSPQQIAIYSNPSAKNHLSLFSKSSSQNVQKKGFLMHSLNSIILPDSHDVLICTNPFNLFKDTTYCATILGTPPQWHSAVSTIGSEAKSHARQLIDTGLVDHEHMIDVPEYGFYVNQNFDLSTAVTNPSGQVITRQYAVRPAIRTYSNAQFPNIMARTASKGVYYAVAWDDFEIDLGLYDEDGDSLAMSIIQPYGIVLNQSMSFTTTDLGFDDIQSIPYASGFNNALPFPCNNFLFAPAQHRISFTPTIDGFYNIMVRIYEYRYGNIIAYSDHIIGIHVDPQVKKQPEISDIFDVTSNAAYYNNAALYTCAGQNIKFKCSIKHQHAFNGNIDYSIRYHGFGVGSTPSANVIYSNGLDSLSLEFTYNSQVTDSDWKYITIETTDTACLVERGLEVKNYRSIPIYVFGNPDTNYLHDHQICAGDTVSIGYSNGLARWIPISGDLTSMSCVGCPYPDVYPQVTTMYVAQPPQGVLNCGALADTVIVNVIPDFDLLIQGDSVICDNTFYTNLKGVILPPVNNLNYKWTPSAFCRPDSLSSTRAYLQADSGWFYLQVWDNFGCRSVLDSIYITRNLFEPEAEIDRHEVCITDTIRVEARGGDFYHWVMKKAYIDCDTCAKTFVVVDLNSESPLEIFIRDEKGCEYEEAFGIIISRIPHADAGSDTTIYDGAVFAIDGTGSRDYSYSSWLPEDYLDYPQNLLTEGQFIPSTDQYILYLSNGSCISADTVQVNVIPCLRFPIPNAFMPERGDKINHFKPNMRDPDTHIKMQIYNRWGNRVYEEIGVANTFRGWDGTINGEMQPVATYVYSIEVDCIRLDGTPDHIDLKGTFNLLR